MVLTRLDDMKAEDTLTIDLRDKSSVGDYMVVSSGRSQRHVGSVADRIVEDLHKAGVAARVEGVPHCDWALIDAAMSSFTSSAEVRASPISRRCGWATGRRNARASLPLAPAPAVGVAAGRRSEGAACRRARGSPPLRGWAARRNSVTPASLFASHQQQSHPCVL